VIIVSFCDVYAQDRLLMYALAFLVARNIEKNYSPHIQPDVETASATVELRRVLLLNAREAVQKYLLRERSKYNRDAKGSKTCKVNSLYCATGLVVIMTNVRCSY
jgi:hypothetical protein